MKEQQEIFRRSVPLVLYGVPFHNLTFASTLEWIDDLVATRRSCLVSTANLDFLKVAAEDPEMQRILFESEIVMADGHPIVKLAPFFGPRLDERVTGSDITPMLAAHAAEKGHRLFFLGAAPGVARKAADILTERHPGLNVVGCFSPEKADVIDLQSDEILQMLEATRPDVLLVAFGAPKQEKWIQMHRRKWNVPVAMGIGGSLDFIAGAQLRSPVWMQRLGLEWLGRLLANPRRLARRYLLDGLFLIHATLHLTAIRCSPQGKYHLPPAAQEGSDQPNGLHAAVGRLPPVSGFEAAKSEVDRLLAFAGEGDLVLVPVRSDWLSSLELGVLLRLGMLLREKGRQLTVCPSSRRVEKLLRAQRFDRCIRIAADPYEALADRAGCRNHRQEIRCNLRGDGCLDLTLPAELEAAGQSEAEARLSAIWSEEGYGHITRIRVEASPLRYIDAAGVALLAGLGKAAEARGIAFSIANLTDPVRRLIESNHPGHLA